MECLLGLLLATQPSLTARSRSGLRNDLRRLNRSLHRTHLLRDRAHVRSLGLTDLIRLLRVALVSRLGSVCLGPSALAKIRRDVDHLLVVLNLLEDLFVLGSLLLFVNHWSLETLDSEVTCILLGASRGVKLDFKRLQSEAALTIVGRAGASNGL